MRGHPVRGELSRPERSQRDGAGERGGRHERGKPRQPRRGEHGARDEEGGDRRRVMELDRGLGRRLREQVGGELRHSCDEDERRGQEQARERKRELEEVRQVAPLGHSLEERERIGERLLDDACGRSADGVVTVVEGGRVPVAEVRHDDGEIEGGQRDAGDGDRRTGEATAAGEREPDPEAGDGQRHFLLREGGEPEERQRRKEAPLVEVPDRVQQQRTRERDRVELVEREPLHRRVEQVGECEQRRLPLRVEVLARKPEHRERAQRDGHGLRD
jgi:hypothetical protein